MKPSTLERHIESHFPWQLPAFAEFTHYLKQNRLPSGLIIHGQKGLGKSKFAEFLIQSLLCEQDEFACLACSDCDLVTSRQHPNLIQVGLEEGSKQIKLQSSPDSEGGIQISEMITKLIYSETQKKIAVIQPAEAINTSAANALLKTLEELGQNKHIFFITNQFHKLPATLISRSEAIHLRFVDSPACQTWWLQRLKKGPVNLDSDQALRQYQALLKLSNQSILGALEFREKMNLIFDYWKYLRQLLLHQMSAHQLANLTSNWNKDFLVSVFIALIEASLYQKMTYQQVLNGQSDEVGFEKQLKTWIVDLFGPGSEDAQTIIAPLIQELILVDLNVLYRFHQDLHKVQTLQNTSANQLLLFENIFTIFSYLKQIRSQFQYPDTFDYEQVAIPK